MAFFDHPDFDRLEQVVLGHDRASGLRALIAIHDTRRGPALGGCRTFAYPDDDTAALRDVLRLSRSTTYKAAMAKVPYGGGKRPCSSRTRGTTSTPGFSGHWEA